MKVSKRAMVVVKEKMFEGLYCYIDL